MSSAVALDLSALSIAQDMYLRQNLPPQFWLALAGKDPWGIENAAIDCVALVKSGVESDSLVGMAVSTMRVNLRYAELLSMAISPECAHETSLALLMDKLEAVLRARKCKTLNYIYSENDPLKPIFESLSKTRGWSLPRLLMADFHFRRDDFAPLWMRKLPSLPKEKGMEIVLWQDLAPAALDGLARQFAAGNIPQALSPFVKKHPIETLNSLSLCQGNEVIGWMVCHRIAPDTIQYTSLYVQPEYHFLGLRLLAMAIFLQQRSAIQQALAVVNVDQVDHSWFLFAKKRLLPYAHTVERHFVSTCGL